jgi:hypothetical protein
LTGKQDRKSASHTAPARRGREVLRILYWCGLSNLALLAAVAWSLDYRPFVSIVEAFSPHEEAVVPADRGDLPPFVFVTVAPGERKMPLPVTVIARSDAAPAEAAAEELAVTDAGSEEVSFAVPEEIEDTQAPRMTPVLRRNPVTGGLEIGNFKPLSFAGGAAECEAIGRSMLEDAGSAADALEVLAASGPIAAARICAANGSVVITCRGGQITVSPRRARPDDKCERLG